MKLCTYLNDGRERVGAIVGNDIIDLPFPDMKTLIQAGPDDGDDAHAAPPADAVSDQRQSGARAAPSESSA